MMWRGLHLAKGCFAVIVLFCVIADAYGQDVAFKVKKKGPASLLIKEEKSLIDVLKEIQEKRHVSFAYQKKYLEGKNVKRDLEPGEGIDVFLKEILASFQLSFKKIGDVPGETIYIIFPEKESEPSGKGGEEHITKVRGSVKGALDGLPMSGVTVLVKNTDTGTITDAEGNYVIEVADRDLSTLVFSFVGFESQEVPVYGRSAVDVVLGESAEQLSEVVVTALGINRDSKTLGYAVSRIPAEELTASGSTNFASALYGKSPGVRIRTAPGGATSGVTLQIRGLNSLNYNTQPLYVIDGVIMRDGNERSSEGLNNTDYFIDPRIRGNGILDINPADIESLTILKGASATALYGSDAASGVVVITTKKGSKQSGMGVEVNYTYNLEQAAFTPHYQNVYGPGFDHDRNIANGATGEGWVPVDTNGDGADDTVRPLFEAYSQFGPRMEGQQVMWWDGTMRSYKPQPDNYKDLYRTGHNSVFNASISNRVSDFGTYRFSVTHQDYEGTQVGGQLRRNTVSLNSTWKLHDKVNLDVAVHYMNSKVHNRPIKINRLTASWNGFFSRAEDMSLFFEKYQTSQGYKWVPYDRAQLNPEEALRYTTPRGYEVMDFLWKQLKNSEDEWQDRVISSVTVNYDILENLRFRARVGNDFTARNTEKKEYNEYPVAFNGNYSTGLYGTTDADYSIFYTDALLTYFKAITSDLTFTVNGGFQMREERYHNDIWNTTGGLVKENEFNFDNSYLPAKQTPDPGYSLLKYAFLGLANISFKDYLFLEATGRQEYSSTLPPGNNVYFYPSVNTSFVFSRAFRLPKVFHYGKLRASHGAVGNAPPVYESNILYDITTLQTRQGAVAAGTVQGSLFGNNKIRPERKFETEFGLETKLFKGNLGFDVTYYASRIKDQILKLDLPTTTGASRILANLGELRSRGWEVALNARPLSGKFNWETSVNMAFNSTKVHELIPGVDWLVFSDMEGSAIKVVAEKGQQVGNIYVYPRKTDENGNFIISSDGLYVIDKTRYVKAGNIMPRYTGGFINSFSRNGIRLYFTIDYSLGGKIVSPSLKYGMGSGLYESTLKYRDAEHGGLPYYIDGNNNKILLPDHQSSSPDGSRVYHDGVVIKGITEEGQVNQKVINAASYYLGTYDWGTNAWNKEAAIYDNSYVKLREVVLSYTLPKRFVERFHCQNVRVSLMARNLFYLWRTLENLDPESTIGTSWLNQGVDDGSSAASRSYGVSLNIGF